MRKIMFLVVLTLISLFLSAKTDENRDVMLLIDISKSMKPVFNEVKGYLVNDLVPELKKGDNLYIILFFGKTETAYNKMIESDNDLTEVKNKILSFSADGAFTDIGNALDSLKSEIANKTDQNKSKYVLLLSDGSHEAPRGSRYYSAGKNLSHELLENARSIDKSGWKVQVLSIGGKEGMKQISREMGAEYKETGKNPTQKELSEKNQDLFYKVDFLFDTKLGLIINKSFNIKGKVASGYNRKVIIDISKVTLYDIEKISKNGSEKISNEFVVREKSHPIILSENESKKTSIFSKFKNDLPRGSYKAKLKFDFNSDVQFSPTVFDVTFFYPCFILNNLYLILIILVFFALVLFYLIRYQSGFFSSIASIFKAKKLLKYEINSSAGKISKEIIFTKNEKKGIGGGGSIINIPASGIKDNIAFIALTGKGFELTVKDSGYFKSKVAKDSFLNKEIELKSPAGKSVKIKFWI